MSYPLLFVLACGWIALYAALQLPDRRTAAKLRASINATQHWLDAMNEGAAHPTAEAFGHMDTPLGHAIMLLLRNPRHAGVYQLALQCLQRDVNALIMRQHAWSGRHVYGDSFGIVMPLMAAYGGWQTSNPAQIGIGLATSLAAEMMRRRCTPVRAEITELLKQPESMLRLFQYLMGGATQITVTPRTERREEFEHNLNYN